MYNITVFGMKYTHIVVIECTLYLHEMLVKAGLVPRPRDERWWLRPSLGTTDPKNLFSESQDWLGFAGGMILSFGTAGRHVCSRSSGGRQVGRA